MVLAAGNDLRRELASRFKGFDAELKFDLIPESIAITKKSLNELATTRRSKAQAFIAMHLKGKNGIVVFKVAGWPDATGHFTLWDGSKMELAFAPGHDNPSNNEYYFWLTSTGELGLQLVQVTTVQFWELK